MRLEFDSGDHAVHLLLAIAPDNVPLPDGLSMKVGTDGPAAIISIESSRELASVRTTIEDLLSAVDLYLRISQRYRNSSTRCD